MDKLISNEAGIEPASKILNRTCYARLVMIKFVKTLAKADEKIAQYGPPPLVETSSILWARFW